MYKHVSRRTIKKRPTGSPHFFCVILRCSCEQSTTTTSRASMIHIPRSTRCSTRSLDLQKCNLCDTVYVLPVQYSSMLPFGTHRLLSFKDLTEVEQSPRIGWRANEPDQPNFSGGGVRSCTYHRKQLQTGTLFCRALPGRTYRT